MAGFLYKIDSDGTECTPLLPNCNHNLELQIRIMWPSNSYLVGHKIVSIICVDHFYRLIIQRYGGSDICSF